METEEVHTGIHSAYLMAGNNNTQKPNWMFTFFGREYEFYVFKLGAVSVFIFVIVICLMSVQRNLVRLSFLSDLLLARLLDRISNNQLAMPTTVIESENLCINLFAP